MITELPWEIIILIAEQLDIEDVFHFGSVCRDLFPLLVDNALCRRLLQVSPPFEFVIFANTLGRERSSLVNTWKQGRQAITLEG